MRDLQNSMSDFASLHDGLLATFTPWTNFSNEPLSSTVFLFLAAASCVLYLLAPLLPWRHLLLLAGWSLLPLGHPAVQARARRTYVKSVRPARASAKARLDAFVRRDVLLDAEPEVLEVEVFELQRRRRRNGQEEWEAWVFSPEAWEPMAPGRVAGGRPRGARFFEDVGPPQGWEWEGKEWGLDLDSREWVEERFCGGLEVEADGEMWVYDIDDGGDDGSWAERYDSSGGTGGIEGLGRRIGAWRRRRWVRHVRREMVRAQTIKVMSTEVKSPGTKDKTKKRR